jgi:hypothetical protein
VNRAREVFAENEVPVTSTLTVEPLTAADRCDRCGAQAYVRVTLPAGSELLFCAHHGREYAPKLRELDAAILDESERLGETQPMPAASAGLSD